MNLITDILYGINDTENINHLVQIIELSSEKLKLMTISDYAKAYNMSYNGVKNNRETITVGGVKFVVDGLRKNPLPF